MKRSIRHTFRGKRYTVRFVGADAMEKPTNFGECDNRDTPKPEIRLRENQQPRNLLDTICHEATHATQPDLSEDAVYEIANCLSSILWKLGYRR